MQRNHGRCLLLLLSLLSVHVKAAGDKKLLMRRQKELPSQRQGKETNQRQAITITSGDLSLPISPEAATASPLVRKENTPAGGSEIEITGIVARGHDKAVQAAAESKAAEDAAKAAAPAKAAEEDNTKATRLMGTASGGGGGGDAGSNDFQTGFSTSATIISNITPTQITATESTITLHGAYAAGDEAAFAPWHVGCDGVRPSEWDKVNRDGTLVVTLAGEPMGTPYMLCYRGEGNKDSVEQMGITLRVLGHRAR